MVVFEMVAVSAAVLSAGMSGAAVMCIREMRDYRAKILDMSQTTAAELRQIEEKMAQKVADFDLVTKKASEANNSAALKLIELENTIAAIDERVAMINGNATVTGAKSWPKNPLRK